MNPEIQKYFQKKCRTFSVPGLKRITVANTAIAVCSLENVKSTIIQIYCETFQIGTFEDDCNRKIILSKATEEVSLLAIPETLKTDILDAIWRVCLELSSWLQYHFLHPGLRINAYMNNFCWTQQVRIDKKKTAERIIQDVKVPIEERFKLACLYCVETNIQALWNEMPSSTKQSLCNGNDRLMIGQADLVRVWVNFLSEGSIYDPIQDDGNLLWQATQTGNKIAAEYFFHRMSSYTRRAMSMTCVQNTSRLMMDPMYTNSNENMCEVFHFLICQLSVNDQKTILKSNTYAVLWSFMCKHELTDCMKMMNDTWKDMTETDFTELLSSTLFKYLKGYDDYDYREVFEELWKQSTDKLKKAICETSHFGAHYLGMLLRDMLPFDTEQKFNVKRVKCFSEHLKKKHSIPYGVKETDWELLKFFVENGISTKASVIYLKKIIDRLHQESFNMNGLEWEQRLQLVTTLLDVEDGNVDEDKGQ